MIEMIDVHKFLGGRRVLQGLDLTVRRGETLVIIGRSGEGKSVTIKHIVGLLKPDSGKVIVDGTDVANCSRRELDQVRQKIGLLFQSGALLNWLTVLENVALPLIEHRLMEREEALEVAMEKLKLLGMEHAADQLPDSISGGMKKRAGLARAIVRNPDIVLYDEPSSGLDPVMTSMIDELINRLRDELKITSIVVTHDMFSAYHIADRIGMLYQGRVVQIGTPDEIRHSEHPLVRQFVEGLTTGPLTDENRGGDAPPPRGSGRWKKGIAPPGNEG